jgi:hypothetical protein
VKIWRLATIALVSVGALVATACEVIFPNYGVVPTATAEAGAGDAGVDAAGCERALPQPRTGRDSHGEQNLQITAAIRTFVFGGDAGTAIGFDLDGVCTCAGDTAAGEGRPSCRSRQEQCDIAGGGRDQAGNVFLAGLDRYSQQGSIGTINDRVALGRFGLIIWIENYNGLEDDPSVTVGSLISAGILENPDAGSSAQTTYRRPNWDGKDEWNIDPAFALGGAPTTVGPPWLYAPIGPVNDAYVTNGTLVAHVPSLAFRIDVGKFDITGVTFQAKITKVGDLYHLDGDFAGRVATRDLLQFASAIKDPTKPALPPTYLCGDDLVYQEARQLVCRGADIMRDASADGTEDAQCDAISIAMRFSAVSAKMGSPVKSLPLIQGCDGSVDDCL